MGDGSFPPLGMTQTGMRALLEVFLSGLCPAPLLGTPTPPPPLQLKVERWGQAGVGREERAGSSLTPTWVGVVSPLVSSVGGISKHGRMSYNLLASTDLISEKYSQNFFHLRFI